MTTANAMLQPLLKPCMLILLTIYSYKCASIQRFIYTDLGPKQKDIELKIARNPCPPLIQDQYRKVSHTLVRAQAHSFTLG